MQDATASGFSPTKHNRKLCFTNTNVQILVKTNEGHSLRMVIVSKCRFRLA